MEKDTYTPVSRLGIEAARRRRGRNWAILIVLAGLCALFYAITIAKLMH